MTEVKKLVDDLDAKLGSLLTGPGSLGDIKDTIEALVDRLHQVNLDFLTTSLNELFADPQQDRGARPGQPGQGAVHRLRRAARQLDLSQALPQADVDTLDADYQKVIDKLAELDPRS